MLRPTGTRPGGQKSGAVSFASVQLNAFRICCSHQTQQANPLSVRALQNANVWFVRTLCSGLVAKLLGKSFLSPVAASGATSAACCTQHPVVDGRKAPSVGAAKGFCVGHMKEH